MCRSIHGIQPGQVLMDVDESNLNVKYTPQKKEQMNLNLLMIEGDHIKVTASKYPFPTVCKEDQATDWFNSLQNCLHWNKRERQKSFAVVESNHVRKSSNTSLSSMGSRNSAVPPQSPPHRKTSSNSNDMTDQVFAKIYDSDSSMDRNPGISSRRQSHASSGSSSSVIFESADEFESDTNEEFDYEPDGFTGWTDDEIIKSRYMANITKELEKVSIKQTSN